MYQFIDEEQNMLLPVPVRYFIVYSTFVCIAYLSLKQDQLYYGTLNDVIIYFFSY
jgi:hypothetical protein